MSFIDQLRPAVRYEGGVSRRLFLAYTGTLSSIPFLGPLANAAESPKFADHPFTLERAEFVPNPGDYIAEWECTGARELFFGDMDSFFDEDPP